MEKVKTIGKDFTLPQLIKFVASPIATQILFSLLMSLDDSLFISRYIGPEGLAAFSIIWPIFMFFDSIVAIFSSAATYCSNLLGEKKNEEAYSAFSTTALVALVFGLACTLIIRTFINPIFKLLGCTELLWPLCLSQYKVQCWFIATSFVSRLFTTFYVVAGKPRVATFTTLTATVINVFFDWLFVGVLKLGMPGTAYANGIGHLFNILFGLFFFTREECEVKLGKPNTELKVLIPTIVKIGFPRTATSLAVSLNSIISHRVLLVYSDEIALSANSIVNSLQFMFMSGYFGLSDSISPIIGYAYGEKNSTKLKRVIKQFLQITLGLSVCIIFLYIAFKKPLVSLYINEKVTTELQDMIDYGLAIAPFAFIFFGITVYGSTVFTDIQDNKNATIISILENVVFANLCVILLPYLFGIDGYWYGFLISEALTASVVFLLLLKNKNKITQF